MEGENGALVFENDTVVPRCEGSNQRSEAVELRLHDATGLASTTPPSSEAVSSGDVTREGGEQAEKLVERSATQYSDGASEPLSQRSQKSWQLSGHLHQVGCRRDFNERSVEIQKQRMIASQRRWLIPALDCDAAAT